MNRFYAPNLTKNDNVYHLDGDESRHCIKVLRNNIGDKVELINGKGLLAIAHISEIKKSDCILNIESFLKKENYPETHLAIAPTKSSDKIEWLVEKASELGIQKISFIICQNNERKKHLHKKTSIFLRFVFYDEKSIFYENKSRNLEIVAGNFLRNPVEGHTA